MEHPRHSLPGIAQKAPSEHDGPRRLEMLPPRHTATPLVRHHPMRQNIVGGSSGVSAG